MIITSRLGMASDIMLALPDAIVSCIMSFLLCVMKSRGIIGELVPCQRTGRPFPFEYSTSYANLQLNYM